MNKLLILICFACLLLETYQTCPINCKSCTTGSTCDGGCNTGYYDQKNGCDKKCQSAIPNCGQCEDNGQKCSDCEKGYNWHMGTNCFKIIEGCDNQYTNLCRECNNRYYKSGNACIKRIDDCKSQSGTVCSQCEDNFNKSSDSKLCVAKIQGCEQQKDDTCDKCDSNYIKSSDNKKCHSKIQKCTKQVEEICETCESPLLKSQDNKQCLESVIENCENQTGKICSKCKEGFKTSTNKDKCEKDTDQQNKNNEKTQSSQILQIYACVLAIICFILI